MRTKVIFEGDITESRYLPETTKPPAPADGFCAAS